MSKLAIRKIRHIKQIKSTQVHWIWNGELYDCDQIICFTSNDIFHSKLLREKNFIKNMNIIDTYFQ